MSEKSNGELFVGCEQLALARENLEKDWSGGEVRLPSEVVQKKTAQAQKGMEDLRVILEVLEKFDSIKLNK